jgi:hypothetical protein
MNQTLKELCVLAVFCGAALRLAPEGSVRRVMRVLVTAVLLIAMLGAAGGFDADTLRIETARLRENERLFAQSADDARRRLDRLVIEEELRAYIQNKAGETGLQLTAVEIALRWDTEGFWLPDEVKLRGRGDTAAAARLLGELRSELGLNEERLCWIDEEGL